QYLSLDWPMSDGWSSYNGLQMLAYAATVFVAAPLAVLSGLRMSPLWQPSWRRASVLLPLAAARRVHLPVMAYFVLFTVVHLTLVASTGVLRNLNHMFGARDDDGLLGSVLFLVSLAVM